VSGTWPVHQVLSGGPESPRETDQRGAPRVDELAAGDLARVPEGLEAAEDVDRLEIKARDMGEVCETGAEGVHDAQPCADVHRYVKREGAAPLILGETRRVQSPKRSTPSPVASRIRTRIAEMGTTESALSESLGWHRTVLSTTLRRLDSGGGLTTPILERLEVALGRPSQWILTGVEPAGVRLADCPGWEEAAKTAADRWGIAPERIAEVGEGRLPRAVRYVDAALIRALSDAL